MIKWTFFFQKDEGYVCVMPRTEDEDGQIAYDLIHSEGKGIIVLPGEKELYVKLDNIKVVMREIVDETEAVNPDVGSKSV